MGASMGNGGAGGGRRRRRRGGSGSAPMAEINITPFVDVMLVLLIIFMVAAPLMTSGVPLELPQTSANPLPSESKPPLTVSVDDAGRIFLGDEELAARDLAAALQNEMQDRSSDRIYLRAHSEIGYGKVMEVMALLNTSGFRNIGLVTKGGRSGGAEAPN
ncbi:MAG: protein TolR [Neomegalonema sp.]|nr:protein TolR [Neomegalonema sp.]